MHQLLQQTPDTDFGRESNAELDNPYTKRLSTQSMAGQSLHNEAFYGVYKLSQQKLNINKGLLKEVRFLLILLLLLLLLFLH